MQEEIRQALLHAWSGYEQFAWGYDELEPLTASGRNWHESSLLMTPVDSLDTLILAGLDEEAKRAYRLIVDRLRFDRPLTVQVFEVTIRLLGGLLSGYQLTGDERLLGLAEDLGVRLLPAFDSPTGMPPPPPPDLVTDREKTPWRRETLGAIDPQSEKAKGAATRLEALAEIWHECCG